MNTLSGNLTNNILALAIEKASEAISLEVNLNVRDGIYSEEDGSRIIMGAAMFLVALGDLLKEKGTKIDNPFWDLN